jgi:hypothetical protein
LFTVAGLFLFLIVDASRVVSPPPEVARVSGPIYTILGVCLQPITVLPGCPSNCKESFKIAKLGFIFR